MVPPSDTELNVSIGIISDDERAEIFREIEKSVQAGRSRLEPIRKPVSSGAVLPFAVTAGAVLIIVLAIFLIPGIYDVDERRLVGDGIHDSGDANELVRALRRDADEQIQEHEETIETLHFQYLQAKTERESLQKDFDTRLKARAAELETELRAALDAERQRLSDSGVVQITADTRLQELEKRLQAQREIELASFRTRLQAEIAERDRSLSEAETRYNTELKRRTDPLKAEIDRLAAMGSAQRTEQQGLTTRMDTLRAELEKVQAESAAQTASLRKELQDSKSLISRLQAQELAWKTSQERLSALLRRYSASVSSTATTGGQTNMLELLQAKVETRALLATDSIKRSNPGLSERLDRYFIHYEEAYRQEGRRAAFLEASEIMEGLIARREPRGSNAGDAELKQFIVKLQALIK